MSGEVSEGVCVSGEVSEGVGVPGEVSEGVCVCLVRTMCTLTLAR